MKDIAFVELKFAGYERKHKITVNEYRTTKNENGTYNIICSVEGKKFIFNDCTFPKVV